MNERIRQIAIQAGYGTRWTSTEQFEEFMEKFAELIVHECAMLDFYKAGHTSVEGDHEISKMILRNFGMME